MIELRDYQRAILRNLYKVMIENRESPCSERTAVVALATGGGKCHGLGTRILMSDGSVKKVEDVSVGDKLMGDDNQPRTVLSLASGQEEMFEITPDDGGMRWTCNRSHILTIEEPLQWGSHAADGLLDMPLEEYLRMYEVSKAPQLFKQVRIRTEAEDGIAITEDSTTRFTVQSIGEGDYYGFQIDGNHRYLLGDGTVTHNTACAGQVVHDTVGKGRAALFLVAQRSLLFQAKESMEEFYDLNPGVIASSIKNPYPDSPVQVCSIDTLVNRDKPENVAVVIVDECHTAGYPKGQRWIFEKDAEGNWVHWPKDAWIIGLSATPMRTRKSEYLGELYHHLVQGPQPSRLMEIAEETEYTEGLCRPIYKGFLPGQQIDLSNVKTRMGDYDKSQLNRAVNTPAVTESILESWRKFGIGKGSIADAKLTLFFGTGLEHAEAIEAAFNREFHDEALAAGFEDGRVAKFLSGDASLEERIHWFGKMKRREILMFSSCDIISVGFDIKEIELVYTRPTQSSVVQIQQEGRGARVAPHIGKKRFLIIDMGLNSLKPGMARLDDHIEYSLQPQAKKKKKGEAPLKICPECGAIVLAFATVCPPLDDGCGYEFPTNQREELEGDLVTLESRADMKQRETYHRLAKQAYRQGYSPAFAKSRFRAETKMPTVAADVTTSDKLWLDKKLFKRVTFAVPGDKVEVKVKSIATMEGRTRIATGQGLVEFPEMAEVDVIYNVKKQWMKGAVFGHSPNQFHYEAYHSFLTQQAKKKAGLKKPEAWVKKWFVSEFGVEPAVALAEEVKAL